MITGVVLISVPYGIGLPIAGAQGFPNRSGFLLVPVLGPWLTLLTRRDSGDCDDGSLDCVGDGLTRGFLIFSGLMQTAGGALLISGLAAPKTVIVRDFVGGLRFTPGAVGRAGGYGALLSGRF